jgi:hypothetical protein
VSKESKKFARTTDLFIYDYQSGNDQLMRLSDGSFINKSQPLEVSQNKFISLSDRNGVNNRYFSKFDSTLNFVDTIVHYRYLARTRPLTNYSRNIIEQDFDKKAGTTAEIVYKNGRYYMFNRPFDEEDKIDYDLPVSDFRKDQSKNLALKDSIDSIHLITVPLDSIKNNRLIFGKDTISFEEPDIDTTTFSSLSA